MLSIQILPVKQVGRLLFSSSITEELPHSIDFEKDIIKKNVGKSEFISYHDAHTYIITLKIEHQFNVQDEAIPHNHSCEILVPPPNTKA